MIRWFYEHHSLGIKTLKFQVLFYSRYCFLRHRDKRQCRITAKMETHPSKLEQIMTKRNYYIIIQLLNSVGFIPNHSSNFLTSLLGPTFEKCSNFIAHPVMRNWDASSQTTYKEKHIYCEWGQTLERASLRGSRCPCHACQCSRCLDNALINSG